jgi:hypothetical protein
VEGLLGLGQRRTVVAAALLDRLEREQDAALGVDVQVGVGHRHQLASARHPLPPGLPPLADGDEPHGA